MNHYPRHIGDWMVATAHLSEVEECMYSRLIDAYYAREAPLPADVAACCRLVRATSTTARKAVAVVLPEFFHLLADGWHQRRCDEEIEKYLEKSEAAKRSIGTRWEKRNTNVDTNVLRPKPERNTNQNQEPIANKEKDKSTRTAAPALPDWLPPDSWDAWKRHRGKRYTAEAGKRQLAKLAVLRAEGHDPTALIDLAIESSWATFWPPKGSVVAGRISTLAERRSAGFDALVNGGSKRERIVEGDAVVVGRGAVLSLPSDLREQGSDDVGGGQPGRSAAGMG